MYQLPTDEQSWRCSTSHGRVRPVRESELAFPFVSRHGLATALKHMSPTPSESFIATCTLQATYPHPGFHDVLLYIDISGTGPPTEATIRSRMQADSHASLTLQKPPTWMKVLKANSTERSLSRPDPTASLRINPTALLTFRQVTGAQNSQSQPEGGIPKLCPPLHAYLLRRLEYHPEEEQTLHSYTHLSCSYPDAGLFRRNGCATLATKLPQGAILGHIEWEDKSLSKKRDSRRLTILASRDPIETIGDFKSAIQEAYYSGREDALRLHEPVDLVEQYWETVDSEGRTTQPPRPLPSFLQWYNT